MEMKILWNPKVESFHCPTSSEEFNLALDEFAHLVYDSLCQFDRTNQIEASQLLTADSVCNR